MLMNGKSCLIPILFLHFYNTNTLTLIRESETNFQLEKTLISMQLPSPISALQSIFMRTGQILNSVLLKQGFQSSYIGMEVRVEMAWPRFSGAFISCRKAGMSLSPLVRGLGKSLSLPPDRCESTFLTSRQVRKYFLYCPRQCTCSKL